MDRRATVPVRDDARVPADRARLSFTALVRVVFVGAIVAAIGSQLALMSFLDPQRADDAAESVASSQFAADLIDDAVFGAVAPVAGQELGAEIARQASLDPRVRDVLRRGLVDAHRSVVEPDAVTTTGSTEINAVIDDVLDDVEAETGVDLSGVRNQITAPKVDPRFVPDAGARPIAQRVRNLAAVLALISAVAVLMVHPRRGRALASLGLQVAIVCGVWAVGLLVTGLLVGAIAGTLFGELLYSLWSSASTAMLLFVCGAGLLGVGVWFAGKSIDGFVQHSRRPLPPPRY